MIARNDCIKKIKNPHEFILNSNEENNKSSVIGGIYGIYILHHWCRSLSDVVVKSSSQNISKNPKNIDVLKHGLLRLIAQSELPRRFRYAALKPRSSFHLRQILLVRHYILLSILQKKKLNLCEKSWILIRGTALKIYIVNTLSWQNQRVIFFPNGLIEYLLTKFVRPCHH